MPSSVSASLAAVALALTLQGSIARAGQSEAPHAREAYTTIHTREDTVRRDLDAQPAGAPSLPLLSQLRSVVGEYDRMTRVFPQSGYSDNALWQAAVLAADAFWAFGEETDRRTALRLFAALGSRFPASSLNRQADSHVKRLEAAAVRPASLPLSAALKSIRRDSLPDALRLTLELERETSFREERLDSPPRVFVDLKGAQAVAALKDATLTFSDDVVRQVRVGRPQGDTTRVVFDLQGAARHSVYVLYEPYRVVIDFERAEATKSAKAAPTTKDTKVTKGATLAGGADPQASAQKDLPGAGWTPEPLPAKPVTVTTGATATASALPMQSPVAPSANLKGGFSLSRQLGLGISRIVIDPGHGGHDPGARVKGLSEADVALDIALRLEKLLAAQPGVEVLLTRRANIYVPLEQRTAIANRDDADLFLSIHVNASESPTVGGIETYFLNFAPNPEAEKIAARENAGASKTMHNLPDIVKAIALNNKIDESRDFASLVQAAMFDRLRKANRTLRDLGVKQAPFMVLIGATMPSVLAEISFLTNRREASLLKTAGYRQQVAESLLTGIMRYQKAVKASQTVASQ